MRPPGAVPEPIIPEGNEESEVRVISADDPGDRDFSSKDASGDIVLEAVEGV